MNQDLLPVGAEFRAITAMIRLRQPKLLVIHISLSQTTSHEFRCSESEFRRTYLETPTHFEVKRVIINWAIHLSYFFLKTKCNMNTNYIIWLWLENILCPAYVLWPRDNFGQWHQRDWPLLWQNLPLLLEVNLCKHTCNWESLTTCHWL